MLHQLIHVSSFIILFTLSTFKFVSLLTAVVKTEKNGRYSPGQHVLKNPLSDNNK